eukprot:CAMPEP_0201527094 /NCGR_PEP_ID=MMETSP0161_2-20130828/33968_1 /ASSEMBLY_ACC=CAM_ASM_000251 /TAXON_ID=180227 /ORGANISM="Neoparamoeba aestuarina, Strain SoJaBio B1-5/56/2" /LENGTH=79 /DNA_ID=CAMNT_0047927757 /DNA_START=231 /DNA_END=467 /DNA_ORIENTATION=-
MTKKPQPNKVSGGASSSDTTDSDTTHTNKYVFTTLLYDFEQEREGEVSVKEGEEVRIIKVDRKNGFYLVRRLGKGGEKK